MTNAIVPLAIAPGIQRDGTVFGSLGNVDGQWVRWYGSNIVRKILGYREVSRNFAGPVRGCELFTQSNYTYVFAGSANQLEVMQISQDGGAGGIQDRTPAAFPIDSNNVWQMGTIFDAVSTHTAIVAHGAPNLLDISSTVETPVYYGDATAATALATTGQSVSGGAVCVQPYLFVYGNDGNIAWSAPNKPNDFTTASGGGSARIAGQKIVKGVSVRGGSSAPAALFWSLDELYKVSFTGSATIFRSDFVAETVLLSSSAVVEADGLYFWPTIDGFCIYNGTVQPLKNDMSRDYFFDDLNFQYRQKVWGYYNKKYGEIWWFYPRGNATECTHYIVYNRFLDTWYDGEMARSFGHAASIFRYPLAFGLIDTGSSQYQLWQHEYGVDEQSATATVAIQSFYETQDISKVINEQTQGRFTMGDGESLMIDTFEPDFIQVGVMNLVITGQMTARSDNQASEPFPFTPNTKHVSIRKQRRELRLRFESNIQGGYFEAGKILLHIAPGDKSFAEPAE